jgi:hypothetical protein
MTDPFTSVVTNHREPYRTGRYGSLKLNQKLKTIYNMDKVKVNVHIFALGLFLKNKEYENKVYKRN